MKPCPVCGKTINDDDTSLSVLDLITEERGRQDAKWGANRNLRNVEWLTILMEEIGEVAKAMLEDQNHVRHELIQVAAVAVAWLECIDRRGHCP